MMFAYVYGGRKSVENSYEIWIIIHISDKVDPNLFRVAEVDIETQGS